MTPETNTQETKRRYRPLVLTGIAALALLIALLFVPSANGTYLAVRVADKRGMVRVLKTNAIEEWTGRGTSGSEGTTTSGTEKIYRKYDVFWAGPVAFLMITVKSETAPVPSAPLTAKITPRSTP